MTSLLSQIGPSLIRLAAHEGAVVGAGFIFAPRKALCLASSVAAACGVRGCPQQPPVEDVGVLLASGETLSAHVTSWKPPRSDSYLDAAVLEFSRDVMPSEGGLRLAVLEDVFGGSLQCIGYGMDSDVPQVVMGRLLGKNSAGWLQVEEPSPGDQLILPGFAGALVYDERLQAVVALLATLEAPGSAGVPVGMPLEDLAGVFSDLPLRLPADHPGRLIGVPDLPAQYVERTDELRKLRMALQAGRTLTPAGAGSGATTAPAISATATGPGDNLRSERLVLQGVPGIGKTALAAAAVRDEWVRRLYPDGIIWVHLGQDPDLPLAQARVARSLAQLSPAGETGQAWAAFPDARQGRRALRSLIYRKACLLILDDVWDPTHAASFDCMGPRGLLLVIGREAGLAGPLRARRISLGQMTQGEALAVLRAWSELGGAPPNAMLPAEALPLADACGRIPFALSLAGGQILPGLDAWAKTLLGIQKADISSIYDRVANYQYPTLLRCLQYAWSELSPDMQARYLDLAIFMAGERIPAATLCTFWAPLGLNQYDVQDILAGLAKNALLLVENENGQVRYIYLHDIAINFLRAMSGNLARLHQRLLDAYGKLPPVHDGYILNRLIYHLWAAGQTHTIKSLLFDFRYLRSRLASSGIDELLEDYKLALRTPPLTTWERDAGGEGLLMVYEALLKSAAFIQRDATALAGQLLGRLQGFDNPDVAALLSGAGVGPGKPWLKPLSGSLGYPGEMMLASVRSPAGCLNAAVMTPDGRQILAAGAEGAIYIWNVLGGKPVSRLHEHRGEVSALSLTADGQRLLSASQAGELIMWDIGTGELLMQLQEHAGRVLSVALAPDGRRVLSGDSEGWVCIWSIDNGVLLRKFHIHPQRISAMAVMPGSMQVVSAGQDIRVWDMETGQVIYVLQGHTGDINALSISPDGEHLVSAADDHTLRIWDLQTGREIGGFRGHTAEVVAAAWLAGTNHIISASADRSIRVWDAATGRQVSMLEGHGAKLRSLAVAADGRSCLSVGEDGSLKVWDLTLRRRLRNLRGHNAGLNRVAIFPDGQRAATTSGDGSVRVWNLGSGRLLQNLPAQSGPMLGICIAPDGWRIFAGSESGTLHIWDAEGRYYPSVLAGHHAAILGISISYDNRRAVTASADGKLIVWNIEVSPEAPLGSGKGQHFLRGHSSWVRDVAMLPDGWRAISVGADHTVRVWDITQGELIYALEGHTGEVNAVAVLAKGTRYVTAGDEGLLRVWDTITGHPMYVLKGHSGEVNGVAATPDGSRIASVGQDRLLCIWDVPPRRKALPGSYPELEGETLRPTLVLEEHTDWINGVALTPDGLRAITCSEDRTAKTWDISPEGGASLGRKPRRPEKHTGAVRHISFARDGRRFSSIAADQNLKVWSAERDERGIWAGTRLLQTVSTRVGLTALAFLPDNRRLASAGDDGVLRLWDLKMPEKPVRMMHGGQRSISGLALLPGHWRLLGYGSQTDLGLWNIESGSKLDGFDHAGRGVLAAQILKDGKNVLTISSLGKLEMWDLHAQRQVAAVSLPHEITAAGVALGALGGNANQVAICDAEGRLALYACDGLSDVLRLGQEPSLKHVSTRRVELARALLFMPGGQELLVACGSELLVLNTHSLDVMAIYYAETMLTCVAVNTTGDVVAAGDANGEIHCLRYGA